MLRRFCTDCASTREGKRQGDVNGGSVDGILITEASIFFRQIVNCHGSSQYLIALPKAMAAQLKEIVDRLNAEPFNCDLSLVGFDEKDFIASLDVHALTSLTFVWRVPFSLRGPVRVDGNSQEGLDIPGPKARC